MNDALDKQRWRRLPALYQQLMRQFHDYAAAETDAAQLDAVKAQLYGAFNALIKRREQRAEVLESAYGTASAASGRRTGLLNC